MGRADKRHWTLLSNEGHDEGKENKEEDFISLVAFSSAFSSGHLRKKLKDTAEGLAVMSPVHRQSTKTLKRSHNEINGKSNCP